MNYIKNYYHSSSQNYEVGEIVSIDNFDGDVCNYHKTHEEQAELINGTLDEHRPTGFPSRKKCIYVFDNKEICLYFGCKNDHAFCYTVKVYHGCGPFPMYLCGKIETYKNRINLQKRIIQEYFNPKKNWNIREYLCKEIEIISKEDTQYVYNDANVEDVCVFKDFIKNDITKNEPFED